MFDFIKNIFVEILIVLGFATSPVVTPAELPIQGVVDEWIKYADEKKQSDISSVEIKQDTEREIPVVDNSAIIKAQVEAELKARAEQEALVAKQKTEEKLRLDTLKAEADRQIAEEQVMRVEAKQQKLNNVNKKIVDLNAKYLEDIESCTKRLRGSGATTRDLQNCESSIKTKYEKDYNNLMVEFQQVKYSD